MPIAGSRSPCSRCGSMDRYRRTASGGGGSCRPCAILTASRWHAAKKASPDAGEFQRHKNLRVRLTKYRLDRERFDRLMESQGGLCAICRSSPATHIDHCHGTGIVRGILCLACNTALGSFRDNVETMLSAVSYLRRA